jgi:hypothetical protein
MGIMRRMEKTGANCTIFKIREVSTGSYEHTASIAGHCRKIFSRFSTATYSP